jgi:NDP-sugar pyrophosphorylase family protein
VKAVVLAGGLGTRLREKVRNLPKPMAEVLGKPFLEWQLELLKSWGIKEVVLSVGYLSDKIKSYFKNGEQLGISIRYAEEEEPLGDGGGLKNACRFLGGDESFLAVNGDTYLDLSPEEFSRFVSLYREAGALVTLALARREKAQKSGLVELRGSQIVRYEEREGVGLVNAGYMLFSREALDYMPQSNRFSLGRDLLPVLVQTGRAHGFVTNSFFLDLGTPQDYENMKKGLGELLRSRQGHPSG